jgi:hypothetical protein
VFFTLSTAAFFGFMHYDFNDFANFQILCVLTSEMILFTFFATRAWPVWLVQNVKECFNMRRNESFDPNDEEDIVLTPLVYASSLAWLIVLIIHMIIVTTVTQDRTPLGTAIGVELFVFFVCVWFGYDAAMIEKRLGPDDYMLGKNTPLQLSLLFFICKIQYLNHIYAHIGVVSFWADCIICVFCCCCIAFAGS